MLIIKIGGSLYDTKELIHWLNKLTSNQTEQPIVIVPGGGPFAEQVRLAQQSHQLDNSSAHHMALLAMAQFGILISDLQSQCKPFYFSETVTPNFPALSVWLPDHHLLSQKEISQNWSFTSDSLALWLAVQLQASKLLLIKREPLSTHSHCNLSADKLYELGIIDPSFPALFNQSSIVTTIMNYQDYDHFPSFLNGCNSVGINLSKNL